MSAVSTAATLSLSDCRHAASLSEMRSSTFTSAISGKQRPLGEAAGQVEADDRPLAAEVAPLRAAERALAARQLGPRRHAVAGAGTA